MKETAIVASLILGGGVYLYLKEKKRRLEEEALEREIQRGEEELVYRTWYYPQRPRRVPPPVVLGPSYFDRLKESVSSGNKKLRDISTGIATSSFTYADWVRKKLGEMIASEHKRLQSISRIIPIVEESRSPPPRVPIVRESLLKRLESLIDMEQRDIQLKDEERDQLEKLQGFLSDYFEANSQYDIDEEKLEEYLQKREKESTDPLPMIVGSIKGVHDSLTEASKGLFLKVEEDVKQQEEQQESGGWFSSFWKSDEELHKELEEARIDRDKRRIEQILKEREEERRLREEEERRRREENDRRYLDLEVKRRMRLIDHELDRQVLKELGYDDIWGSMFKDKDEMNSEFLERKAKIIRQRILDDRIRRRRVDRTDLGPK